MKTSQSFPFYPLDFAFGTMTMTPAQVGGYMRALCYQWETGGFPIDENQQKIVTGCDETDLKIILGKFVKKKTKYINLRMEQVRKERLHFLEIQRLNGKKGGRPRKNPWVSNGLTQTEPKKTLPSPSPSPSPIDSAEKPRRATQPAPDAEWIASLSDNPAFSGIDIPLELARAQAWTAQRNRQCTRRFFTNWLLRAEKPITANGTTLPLSKRY